MIKSKSGNIFGGFTEKSRSTKNEPIQDKNAFIFSLVNKENKPFKAMCSNDGENAIICNSISGPCLGGTDKNPKDIHIRNESNKNNNSSKLFSFKYPEFENGIDKSKTILAGSHSFAVEEIEVYRKLEDY